MEALQGDALSRDHEMFPVIFHEFCSKSEERRMNHRLGCVGEGGKLERNEQKRSNKTNGSHFHKMRTQKKRPERDGDLPMK